MFQRFGEQTFLFFLYPFLGVCCWILLDYCHFTCKS